MRGPEIGEDPGAGELKILDEEIGLSLHLLLKVLRNELMTEFIL